MTEQPRVARPGEWTCIEESCPNVGTPVAAKRCPLCGSLTAEVPPEAFDSSSDEVERRVATLEQLAASAPRLGLSIGVDWAGVGAAASAVGFDPSSALAATWCRFGDELNPLGSGAPTNGKDVVALIFPAGVLATTGRRTRRGIDAAVVPFGRCRSVYTNHFDGIGFGHYIIHFVGPGDILLGFLYWSHDAPKPGLRAMLGIQRDYRNEMMAVAEEYERVLGVVESVMNG